MISAFLCLLLNFAFVVLRADISSKNPIDRRVFQFVYHLIPYSIPHEVSDFWMPILEKVVLSLSDQQLLTGISILVAGFWTHCSISVYHFTIINELAFFSSGAHLITVTVLRDYLMERPRMKHWRTVLMAVVALFLIASSIMQGHWTWNDSWPYNAQCLFDDLVGNFGGSPGFWSIYNVFIIALYYPINLVNLYERPSAFLWEWIRRRPSNFLDAQIDLYEARRFVVVDRGFLRGNMYRASISVVLFGLRALKWTHNALTIIISTVGNSQCIELLMNTFWFAYSLWTLIADRSVPQPAMDGEENRVGVGQIIPLLLLSSTVLVLGEAYHGKSSSRCRVSQSK